MKRSWILPVILVLVAAWDGPAWAAGGRLDEAVAGPAGHPPRGYTHTVETSQVALYWNCARPDPGTMRLQGVAVNPWSDQPVQFLRFDLVGVNARGHSVSSASIDARDILLRTNQQAPFTINLRTAGIEERFDLYYQYLFQDRGHNPFFSMAAWDGAASSQKPPVILAWTNQFMVRDASSPTEHLVR
jgi:hypothetical protein